jgi:methyltransferase (TIGR00027 family)
MTVSHPVARTAFYCCTLRADDAAAAKPVCGDTFAARFVDDDVRRELAPLLSLRAPSAANVARHRLIDDLMRPRLAENPATRVILLGAGFDTRAFRLEGGRWWEVDDPQLLTLKEERLPASTARNPLVRVPVAFQTDDLAGRLAPLAGDDRALVVLEGVTMYLEDDALARVAGTVRSTFPRATLTADLMTPAFARTYSRALRRELTRLGATFGARRGHPRNIIASAGYTVRERHSIAGRAREAGTLKVPGVIFHTVLRGLRDGYAVWVFEPATSPPPPAPPGPASS